MPDERAPRTPPAGVRRSLRRPLSVVTALTAVISTASMAGPLARGVAGTPCALERTDAHHSLGVSSWDSSYVRPEGRADAVMLFLSFPDSRPGVTPQQLTRDYFPATSDFFRQASYGRFDLRAHPVPRWIEMPKKSTAYDIARDWSTASRASFLRDALAVTDPEVDFGEYDIVYLVADPDAPGVDSDATKVVNFKDPIRVDGTELNRVVTLFERYPADRNVLAHETGHVFDLPDLYNRPEDGKGDWDTHVGDWDLMGSQFGLAPDPFGWHRWKLGWLDDEQVDCVWQPGTSLHTLVPLGAEPEEPRWGGGADDGRGGAQAQAAVARARPASRMAVVRTGAHEAIVLEVREPLGNDVSVCTSGVLAYRVTTDRASADGPVEVLDGHPDTAACHGSSVRPELADAPLRVGESLSVDGGDVRISVLDQSESGEWNLRITRR
ncbi:M6 family metalloprotease domain-containing protein [Streptomyces sp. XM4193]|uniref:M6 family metalloprotease domain-containing protein n=1 Tax=Streptomyces sp. XM4193 TaxID=2929782 RepID=UPI001FF8887B|nr:M6 family metalloprotease domain-containing protein [Streptomyces sp. XM4193]MCK1798537.1 M6 family metalloprotease domain-containing protein [Streptomyces sp. XM4193]